MSRHKSKAGAGPRNVRLADQIQKDLAVLIQREIDVSRAGLVTLSGVELTTDYAHAKVYFTVLGAEPETAAALLNEKAGWLHSQLYRMLHIHTVPRLRFFHDSQVARGIEMSQLIDRANRPGPYEERPDEFDEPDEPEEPDESRS
jgi:ribosome-binding factor A